MNDQRYTEYEADRTAVINFTKQSADNAIAEMVRRKKPYVGIDTASKPDITLISSGSIE